MTITRDINTKIEIKILFFFKDVFISLNSSKSLLPKLILEVKNDLSKSAVLSSVFVFL